EPAPKEATPISWLERLGEPEAHRARPFLPPRVIHAEVGAFPGRQVEPEAGPVGRAHRSEREDTGPDDPRRREANDAKAPDYVLAPLHLAPQRGAVAPAPEHVRAQLAAAQLRQSLERYGAGRSRERELHGENRAGSHGPIDPSI